MHRVHCSCQKCHHSHSHSTGLCRFSLIKKVQHAHDICHQPSLQRDVQNLQRAKENSAEAVVKHFQPFAQVQHPHTTSQQRRVLLSEPDPHNIYWRCMMNLRKDCKCHPVLGKTTDNNHCRWYTLLPGLNHAVTDFLFFYFFPIHLCTQTARPPFNPV